MPLPESVRSTLSSKEFWSSFGRFAKKSQVFPGVHKIPIELPITANYGLVFETEETLQEKALFLVKYHRESERIVLGFEDSAYYHSLALRWEEVNLFSVAWP